MSLPTGIAAERHSSRDAHAYDLTRASAAYIAADHARIRRDIFEDRVPALLDFLASDQRSTRLGPLPPLTASIATCPSSSKAQQAAPAAPSIERASSATLSTTLTRSCPARPAIICRRTELAMASSFARWSLTVRSAMPTTGAALSSSWTSSAVKG